MPGIKFGPAFCESSGPCLVRCGGTDTELSGLAANYALDLACGHCFVILLKNAYPINVLPKLREVPEVANFYVTTANPLTVLIIEDEQGRGIVGVIDGFSSKGIETEKDAKEKIFYEILDINCSYVRNIP